MTDDLVSALGSYFTTAQARPLGRLQLASGRTLQPFSIALREGADNLLDKAVGALEAGDVSRASRYVDRAAALPYDEHEQTQPVLGSARMRLFDEIIDAMEDADEEDSEWLTTAIAVLGRAEEGAGATCLRHLLSVVAQDFSVTKGERRLLRGVVDPRLVETELGLAPDSSTAEVAEVALSVVTVALAYHRALYHH